MSGAAALRVFPGSEFEPLPGTHLVYFRPSYFILLRVVALAWALVRGVRLVQRPLVGTGILTVPPATS